MDLGGEEERAKTNDFGFSTYPYFMGAGIRAGITSSCRNSYCQNKSLSARGYRGGGVSAHFYATPVKRPTGGIIELRGKYYLYKGDDVLLKRRFSLLSFEYAYEYIK